MWDDTDKPVPGSFANPTLVPVASGTVARRQRERFSSGFPVDGSLATGGRGPSEGPNGSTASATAKKEAPQLTREQKFLAQQRVRIMANANAREPIRCLAVAPDNGCVLFGGAVVTAMSLSMYEPNSKTLLSYCLGRGGDLGGNNNKKLESIRWCPPNPSRIATTHTSGHVLVHDRAIRYKTDGISVGQQASGNKTGPANTYHTIHELTDLNCDRMPLRTDWLRQKGQQIAWHYKQELLGVANGSKLVIIDCLNDAFAITHDFRKSAVDVGSIRELSFSPHDHYIGALAAEKGCYLFDLRKTGGSSPFIAIAGSGSRASTSSVCSLDFHPLYRNLLVTAHRVKSGGFYQVSDWVRCLQVSQTPTTPLTGPQSAPREARSPMTGSPLSLPRSSTTTSVGFENSPLRPVATAPSFMRPSANLSPPPNDTDISIECIAPPSRVRWAPVDDRQNRDTIFASIAFDVDYDINIWDASDPYTPAAAIYQPYANASGSGKAVKDFEWLSPDEIISCSENVALISRIWGKGIDSFMQRDGDDQGVSDAAGEADQGGAGGIWRHQRFFQPTCIATGQFGIVVAAKDTTPAKPIPQDSRGPGPIRPPFAGSSMGTSSAMSDNTAPTNTTASSAALVPPPPSNASSTSEKPKSGGLFNFSSPFHFGKKKDKEKDKAAPPATEKGKMPSSPMSTATTVSPGSGQSAARAMATFPDEVPAGRAPAPRPEINPSEKPIRHILAPGGQLHRIVLVGGIVPHALAFADPTLEVEEQSAPDQFATPAVRMGQTDERATESNSAAESWNADEALFKYFSRYLDLSFVEPVSQQFWSALPKPTGNSSEQHPPATHKSNSSNHSGSGISKSNLWKLGQKYLRQFDRPERPSESNMSVRSGGALGLEAAADGSVSVFSGRPPVEPQSEEVAATPLPENDTAVWAEDPDLHFHEALSYNSAVYRGDADVVLAMYPFAHLNSQERQRRTAEEEALLTRLRPKLQSAYCYHATLLDGIVALLGRSSETLVGQSDSQSRPNSLSDDPRERHAFITHVLEQVFDALEFASDIGDSQFCSTLYILTHKWLRSVDAVLKELDVKKSLSSQSHAARLQVTAPDAAEDDLSGEEASDERSTGRGSSSTGKSPRVNPSPAGATRFCSADSDVNSETKSTTDAPVTPSTLQYVDDSATGKGVGLIFQSKPGEERKGQSEEPPAQELLEISGAPYLTKLCTLEWETRALEWYSEFATSLAAVDLYSTLHELRLCAPIFTNAPAERIEMGSSSTAVSVANAVGGYCFLPDRQTFLREYLYWRPLKPLELHCGKCDVQLNPLIRPKRNDLAAGNRRVFVKAHRGGPSSPVPSATSFTSLPTSGTSGNLTAEPSSENLVDGTQPVATSPPYQGSPGGSGAAVGGAPSTLIGPFDLKPSLTPPVAVTSHHCLQLTKGNLCGQVPFTCIFCEGPVGSGEQYMWVRSCGHGGHTHHVLEWVDFCKRSNLPLECPTCGVPMGPCPQKQSSSITAATGFGTTVLGSSRSGLMSSAQSPTVPFHGAAQTAPLPFPQPAN